MVDNESHDIAKWLNGFSISGVVLKYITRPKGITKSRDSEDSVLRANIRDAQQAIRITRECAETWGLQLTRLGEMGFSA